MIRLLSVLFVSMGLAATAQGQAKQYGKIKLTEEKSITALLSQSEKNLGGYRIQVFTGNASERKKAQRIRAFVETTFGVNAYVDYESPLFKVRVGDFPDKLEAIALRHKLKKYYNNAYLIKVRRIHL